MPTSLPVCRRSATDWRIFETLFDYEGRRQAAQAIEQEMSLAGFWDDPDRAKNRVLALKTAKSTVVSLDELKSGIEDLDLLAEIAREQDDFASWEEVDRSLVLLEQRYAALELRTLMTGKFDAGNAVLTIQSGAGGTDAADWALMLLRMYTRWSERSGYSTELLEVSDHEEAGIKHATLRVTGPYAFGFLTAEMGVHRLVRISPFDAQGRRQTSFAAIDVIPDVEDEPDIEVDERDLRVDTYRAGGKGGQHVNKTESAVRLTHLPTGVVVQCQTERSQFKNKSTAMKLLKARLVQLRESERNKELQALYDSKGQIAWGNQIRSYVLAPYTMVKDERSETPHKEGNAQAVLDGGIQSFIDSWLKERASKK